MWKRSGIFLLAATTLVTQSARAGAESTFAPPNPSGFIGLRHFEKFTTNEAGRDLVLTSPEIPVPISWKELVVSWNAAAPAGTFLKIEARGVYPERATKFYTLGLWSEDALQHPRESVSHQKDSDGNVSTDTLILEKAGARAQIRVTLGSAEDGKKPALKFLGLSFLDPKTPGISLPSNQK
ncbi:MAG: hypothetical protein ABIV39_10110, partial [Verrucomicrobiota bacterium]